MPYTQPNQHGDKVQWAQHETASALEQL